MNQITFSNNMFKLLRFTEKCVRYISTLSKLERIKLEEVKTVGKFWNNYYVSEEPLNKYLNVINNAKSREISEQHFTSFIEKGDAYKIEDSGKLVFVGIYSLVEKDIGYNEPKIYDPNLEKITKLAERLVEKADVFNKFGVTKFISTDYGATQHPDYRKMGFVRDLLQLTENAGKKLGCELFCSITTGAFTKKACERYGMKQIVSIKYEDYKVNGETIFKPEPPHTEAAFFIKHI